MDQRTTESLQMKNNIILLSVLLSACVSNGAKCDFPDPPETLMRPVASQLVMLKMSTELVTPEKTK